MIYFLVTLLVIYVLVILLAILFFPFLLLVVSVFAVFFVVFYFCCIWNAPFNYIDFIVVGIDGVVRIDDYILVNWIIFGRVAVIVSDDFGVFVSFFS